MGHIGDLNRSDGIDAFIGTWKGTNLSPYYGAVPGRPDYDFIVIDEATLSFANNSGLFANGYYFTDYNSEDDEIVKDNGVESITFKITGTQNDLLGVTFSGGMYGLPQTIIYALVDERTGDSSSADGLNRFFRELEGTWNIKERRDQIVMMRIQL